MKKIKINKDGVSTLVDNDIFVRVTNYKWHLHSGGYCCRNFWNKKTKKYSIVYLHRFVMNAKKGEEIDHINRNKLDNRRCNLRFSNRYEQMRNAKYKVGMSGYTGVTWHNQNNYWTAKIRIRGKRVHLGCFNNPKEASDVYKKALSI